MKLLESPQETSFWFLLEFTSLVAVSPLARYVFSLLGVVETTAVD